MFVRHGVTDWNLDKRVMGQLNIPLNEEGRHQAKSVGLVLEKYNIQYIFSSDSARAWETTQLIAQRLKRKGNDIKIIKLPELRERSMGELEGRYYEEIRPLFFTNGRYRHDFRPANGESAIDFAERVAKALEKIKNYHEWKDSDDILIVTHGGVIRQALGLLFFVGERPPYYFPMNVANTSITIVKWLRDDYRPYRLVKANWTPHLSSFTTT